MADTSKPRRRGGGRAGAANRRGTATIEQMPWRIPVNTDRPTEPLGPDGVQAIHDGAMRILEDIGIEFLNEDIQSFMMDQGEDESETLCNDVHQL